MTCWSALTTARTGLSFLCDVIQWMSGWRLRCACMQSSASTHHSEPHLTACQVKGGGGGRKHTIQGRKPDLLYFHQHSRHPHPARGRGFPAASLSPSLSLLSLYLSLSHRHPVHHFFFLSFFGLTVCSCFFFSCFVFILSNAQMTA